MATESFGELLQEMPKIAEAVNQFSSETVQAQVYETLMAALLGKQISQEKPSTEPKKSGAKKTASSHKPGGAGTKSATTTTRSSGKETHSVVPDLNLRPRTGKSLGAFITAKAPKTNEEHFAVMIYYMQKQLKITSIGVDHIYTCFSDIKVRVPSSLRTVLGNAARRKGWFSSSVEDLKLTTHGENFVDHDLPHEEG